MNDHKDSAMIALLPVTTDWCHIELPHMTLVYAGEIQDLKPTTFNEMAKDAASLAMLARPLFVKVMGVEIFGSDEKVDALRIEPSQELLAMRRAVESWNASEFPFVPHATIGPTGMHTPNVPGYLSFDRIMVQWGKESLTFWLKK